MNRLLSMLILSALLSMPALAGEAAAESVKLKHGSARFIDKNGDMKMVDGKGDRMTMRDGVPMETEDGRIIMMRTYLKMHLGRPCGVAGSAPVLMYSV